MSIGSSISVQIEPPGRVAENLMLDTLSLFFAALDSHTRPGRGEHVQAVGGADFMNAEEMRSVADDDQPPQAVGAGNHGDAAGRLLGVAALGFGDDVALRYTHAHQVLAAHGTFVVLVAAVSTQGDGGRGGA